MFHHQYGDESGLSEASDEEFKQVVLPAFCAASLLASEVTSAEFVIPSCVDDLHAAPLCRRQAKRPYMTSIECPSWKHSNPLEQGNVKRMAGKAY